MLHHGASLCWMSLLLNPVAGECWHAWQNITLQPPSITVSCMQPCTCKNSTGTYCNQHTVYNALMSRCLQHAAVVCCVQALHATHPASSTQRSPIDLSYVPLLYVASLCSTASCMQHIVWPLKCVACHACAYPAGMVSCHACILLAQ